MADKAYVAKCQIETIMKAFAIMITGMRRPLVLLPVCAIKATESKFVQMHLTSSYQT